MSGVCMMVTRRKEAELARLAAAEEASRLKDEFLATLSHELRTPLNAILGWVQMLQSGDLSSARAQQAIEVIGRNAGLQAQLIEDILDVSRIISGKLEIDVAPVAMPALLDAVVAGVSVAAEAKRITVECRIAGDLPPIEGDPKRLQQVLSNVLANAVKFTPEGGAITIDMPRAVAARLEIEVRDTGVGIAPDFLPYVFDRFRQADSRPTRSHGGLGLGLAIARHLVEQHGGTIAAHSDGLGLGTTVAIRLPVPCPGRDACRCRWPPADEAVRLDGMTIAVVDDEPDSREVLAALLEQRGARVHQCDSARSVLHVLNTQPLDAADRRHRHAARRRLRADRAAAPAGMHHPGDRGDGLCPPRGSAEGAGRRLHRLLRQADRRADAGEDRAQPRVGVAGGLICGAG